MIDYPNQQECSKRCGPNNGKTFYETAVTAIRSLQIVTSVSQIDRILLHLLSLVFLMAANHPVLAAQQRFRIHQNQPVRL
ncbi:hypothetical protein [Allopontixanthobacter confluentis]|uniref:hypothetical protein n=1 Tax=Allopontixanthobacter confluentis TaxID=1849021 RepID=UPI001371846F|nr:hypothetical protein [Allopontixanthobacter confluentis]